MKQRSAQYSITQAIESGEVLTMSDIFGSHPIVLGEEVKAKRVYKSRVDKGKRKTDLPLRYRQYIYRAKSRGLEFNLTLEQFNSLIPGKCVYCGLPSDTIDRRVSSMGYLLSNCCSCCRTCNSMKNALSTGAFLRHIALIYSHLTTK